MSFFGDLREGFKQGSGLEPSINYKAEKERLDAQKQDEITLKQKQQLEEENPLTTRIAKGITEIPTKFWGGLFGGLGKLFEFEKIEEIEKRADDTSIAKTQKYVHDISRDYSSSIARAEVGAKVVKEKADDIYNKARKLETLQPYTAERQNLTKELNTLKGGYSNSLELYKNEINKINDLTKQRELYEKTRGPAAEYFEDPAKRNFFIANTYQKLDDATDINNRKDYESTKIAKTSIDAVVKNLQTAGEDYIKAGVIDDYEDFYTAPEIIKGLDTYSNGIKKLVMENHDKLLDENGNIDKLKLDSMMANSEEAIMLNAGLDEFLRNTKNDAKLKLYKEKVDKGGLLRGGYYAGGMLQEMVAQKMQKFTAEQDTEIALENIGVGEQTFWEYLGRTNPFIPTTTFTSANEVFDDWRAYNRGDRTSLALPNSVRDIISDITGDKRVGDAILNKLTSDPFRGAMLAMEIPLMIAGGGASRLPKVNTAIKSIQAAEGFRKANRARMAAGGVKEILFSLPFDSTIDSINGDANILTNFGLNFAGGLLGKGKSLSLVDNIMEKSLKAGDDVEKLKVLNSFFSKGQPFVEGDLKDIEKLHSKVTNIIKIDSKNILKNMHSQIINKAVDELETADGIGNFIEKQKNLTRNGIELGQDFKPLYDKIETNYNKYISLSPELQKSEEGLKLFDGMKQDLKAIGDTFSVETISKLNNLKIENTLDNSLFNELYQKIYAKYGNKDMSAVVATDVIMGGNKTAAGVIRSVYSMKPSWGIDLGSDVAGLENIINKAVKFQESYKGKNFTKSILDAIDTDANIKEQISKLSKTESENARYLNSILSGKDTRGVGAIEKRFTKNVKQSKLAKTISNVGGMIKNMAEGGNWKDDFNKLVNDVFDSIPKKHQGKIDAVFDSKTNPEGFFRSMVNDYVLGDFNSKAAIMKSNKQKGLGFLNGYLSDIDNGLLDSAEVASIVGEKTVAETLTNLGLDSALSELPGGKTVKEFVKKHGDTFTRYQYTLINGVAGGINRVPPLKEVTKRIGKSIKNGGIPDIPSSYFTREGQQLLLDVLDGVEGADKIIIDAFDAKIIEQRNANELLGQFFVDGKVSPKIMVEGQEVLLEDVLKTIDMRITGEFGQKGGGIIESQFMVMTKYLMYDEKSSAEFLKTYSNSVDKLFGSNETAQMINQTFNAALYGADAKEIKSLGENYVEIINRVKNNFKETGMDITVYNDLVHPMIFNPHEYILGLSQVPSEQIVDTLTDLILRRYEKYGEQVQKLSPKELRQLKNRLFGDRTIGQFNGYGDDLNAQLYRNKNAQEIEGIVAEEFSKSGGYNISKQDFDSYRYDAVGYFIVQPRVGFTSNMNQTIVGDISNLVEHSLGGMPIEVKTKIIMEGEVQVKSIFNSMEKGEFTDAAYKLEQYDKFLKNNNIPNTDIRPLLNDLEKNIKDKKKLAGNIMYKQRFFDVINQAPERITEEIVTIEKLGNYDVEYVPVSTIDKYKEFDRSKVQGLKDDNYIEELKADIQKNGIKEPFILTYYQGNNTALLIEGNTRLLAAKKLGIKDIPVRVLRESGNGPEIAKKVSGAIADKNGYVPSDLIPSDIGIGKRKRVWAENKEREIKGHPSIEQKVEMVERKKEAIEMMKDSDALASQQLVEDSMVSFEMLKGNGKGLQDSLFSLGIGLDSDEAVKIYERFGMSKKAIESFKKTGKLSEEQTIDTIMNLMAEGRVSFMEAMGNRRFANMMAEKLDEAGKKVKSGYTYRLDPRTREMRLVNEGKLPSLVRAFASWNVLAKKNYDLRDIIDSSVKKEAYSISAPTLEGLQGIDSINIKAYANKFNEGLDDLLKKNKVTADEYAGVMDEVLISQNQPFKNLNYKGTDDRLADVYDYLNQYFSDVRKFRGEALPIGYTQNFTKNIDMTFRSHYRKNAINRLTGRRLYMSNNDIGVLANKLQPGDGFFAKRFIGDKIKDLAFGGIMDTGIAKKVGNAFTRTAMNIMFGPQAILKAPQQIINNFFHAKGHINAMGFDGGLLDEMNKFFFDGFNLRIEEGIMKDVQRGYEIAHAGGKKFGVADAVGKVLSQFERRFNVMQLSDNATKSLAKKTAMSDAFYDMYAVGGEEAVNKFMQESIEMDGFMKKYGFNNAAFYHKTDSLSTIKNIAQKNGDDFNREVDKFNDFANFYKSDYSQTQLRARSTFWTFYASETIPEFSSIGIIDNNRSIFALKKRAFSKFTEYSYDIVSEIKLNGFKGFVSKVMEGKIPIFKQMADEVVSGLRMGWAIDRATDGEMDIKTTMKYLIIPFTVTMMTLGDGIEKWIDSTTNLVKLGENQEDVTKGELRTKAIGMGLIDGVQQIISTSFLYNYAAIQPILAAKATATETDSISNGISALFKQILIKPLTKFFTSNYGGYEIDSDFDGNTLTNIFESALNIRSRNRMEQQEAVSRLYSAEYLADGGWIKFLKGAWNETLKNTFITGTVGADHSILQRDINNRKKQNKTNLFIDEFAVEKDKEGYKNLQMNYDKVAFYNKFETTAEGKQYMLKNKLKVEDLDTVDQNKLFEAAIEMGIASPDSDVFKDTLKALNGTLGISKAVRDSYYELIPENDRIELERYAGEMFVSNSKETKDLPSNYFRKFVDRATGLGTNYTVAGLMTAMQKGVDKALQKKYGIKEGRVVFGKDSDEYTFVADTVGARNTANDMAYVNESRAIQHQLLEIVQPILGKNNKVGMALEYKMLSTDPDNPINNFSPKMQTINMFDSYQKAIKEDGYISDNVMNIFNMNYSAVAKRLQDNQNIPAEEKEQTFKILNEATKIQIDTIDEAITNKYEKSIAKMGLAYAISPFIETLNNYDEEGLKEVIDKLGNGFVSMIDSLTSANPNDMETSFEMASGINLHKDGKGKADKAKKNVQALFKANTKAVNLTKKLSAAGFNLSPVKANYSIQKTKVSNVELEEVKIDLVKLPKPKIELPVGGSAKTADLTTAVKKISRSTTKSQKPKKIKQFKSPRKL